jgi:hypothetical protein
MQVPRIPEQDVRDFTTEDVSSVELTAGLNSPPLMRKNIHTLTSREKPNASAMYNRIEMFGGDPASPGGVFAT